MRAPQALRIMPIPPAMERRNIATNAPWAAAVGYSRAVRLGPFVAVSGTAPVDETGRVVAPGDPYGQATAALRIIEDALAAAGARLADVVRTRMYLTDIDHWQAVGRAHGEFFGDIRPATTMIEVRRLIAPEILVEIEADAIIAEE